MLDTTTKDVTDGSSLAGALDEFEALRGKIRDASREDNLSLGAIAKQAGIGESTLPAWMSKRYGGSYERIAENLRNWLESRDAGRQTRAVMLRKPDFIETPSATKFLTVLHYAQSLGRMATISGGAGIGKTTAIGHYKAHHPNVVHVTAAPKNATAAQIMEDICEELGLPEMAGTKRHRAICNRLAGRQALLVVDEAQHLKMNGLEQLRAISDRAQVGLALVGNIEVNRRVDGGGRKAEFAQVFSRLGMRVEVQNSSEGDIKAMLDALGITQDKVRNLLAAIARRPGGLRQMEFTLDAAMQQVAGAGVQALQDRHVTMAASVLEGRQ